MVEQDAAPAGGRRPLLPSSRAATGLRLGDTMTPRQELADRGPLKHAVAESAARRRQDAAMARRKAPHLPKRKVRT